MQLSFCLIEQWPVNVLDRRRFQVEQLDRCLHRVVDAREKNQAEPFLAGQGRNFELSRKNRGQRSLAACENFIQILRRTQEAFEAVSRPAFDHSRWPALSHFRALLTQQSLNLRAFSFERASLRTNFCDSSISQNNLGREDVIGGCSIKRRTRSRGIVRDHSADGSARTRRHIGTETKAVRLQKIVQLIQHHAGADAHASFFQIEFRNAAIMS